MKNMSISVCCWMDPILQLVKGRGRASQLTMTWKERPQIQHLCAAMSAFGFCQRTPILPL